MALRIGKYFVFESLFFFQKKKKKEGKKKGKQINGKL